MADEQPGGLWRPVPARKGDPAPAPDQGKPGDGPSKEQQPVARPILREAPWEGKLTRARAHVAVVVVYQRGDHLVIWPHDRKRVLLYHRPATTYEIDLGLHSTSVAAVLPSRGHEGSFQADINVHWRVFNPSAIVRHRVTDIGEAISPALLRRARSIAREFGLDQVSAAEDKLNEQLSGVEIDVTAPAGIEEAMREATDRQCIGAEYGLWTRIIVHLDLDEAATQHNAKMKRLAWAIQEEQAAQELRLLQNRNQQAITTERMEIYRRIIAAGNVDQFALRLTQHPEEISAITAIIREDRVTGLRDTVEFISRMVESGVVERWEVSDQVREALEWLGDTTTRILTDTDHPGAEIEPPPGQRRRGRGQPIEQRRPGPPPEAIVVEAEVIHLDEHGKSEALPDAIAGEAGSAPGPD